MATDLRNYAVAFLVTIVVEAAVAVLLGYRKRREIAAVVLVNVFSHPMLCYLIWIADSFRAVPTRPVEIAVLEIGVVVVEWSLLCYALPQRGRSRLLLLSAAMNCVSYLSGFLFFV
jgi:hypothetical protein